jgi:hypothetical protein
MKKEGPPEPAYQNAARAGGADGRWDQAGKKAATQRTGGAIKTT